MKRVLLLVIALNAPLASAVYRCVDERGMTLFGDVPPAACTNVPIYEVSKSGVVVRRIDPTPTPDQLKARLQEQEQRKLAEKLAAEQKRKDMALLNSYTNAREFDVARERNIEPVTGRIASAEERIKELDQREKQLNEQIKSYEARDTTAAGVKAEAPAWMLSEMERLHKERNGLRRAIASYHKEIEELRARYETDKQRWIVLKGGARTAETAASGEAVKPPARGSKRSD